MIVYSLVCKRDHMFEGWFKDSDTCDQQLAGREILCPVCGDKKVRKAPMAPAIAKGRSEPKSRGGDQPSKDMVAAGKMMEALRELRAQIEVNCDYVGDRFADEARKIHYGETDPRGIYGEATKEETTALREEGVDFHGIPWLPRHDS